MVRATTWISAARFDVRNTPILEMAQNDFFIRPIAVADDAAIAGIIRGVMPEFGASGPGFAIHDVEVDTMTAAYARGGCAYFVVTLQERVLGGGGVAPLGDGDEGICELRKMYFLPELRGRGAGAALIGRCLDAARTLGHRTCYLETLTGMDAAKKLYEKHGFVRIPAALGNTGHFSCDRFYLLQL